MSHKQTLKQLWPIVPENLDDEVEVPGSLLDDVREASDALKAEMHPDTCTATIEGWERIYGIVPGPGDTLQERRDRASAKRKATGGVSQAYLIKLAAAMGYTVTIQSYKPFILGESVCGDILCSENSRFIWKVTVDAAGSVQELEDELNSKKHSRVALEFEYTS